MKFLRKNSELLASNSDLRYKKSGDNSHIREKLMAMQLGFCAYSEKYLEHLDSVEIEHFDPRLKDTDRDNISNWHAVLRWMNAHKPKNIEPYLPLPNFDSWNFSRLEYSHGQFTCEKDDVETKNLIEFLGVNRPEPTEARRKHVAQIAQIQKLMGDLTLEEILRIEHLSFPTALENELGIPVTNLINKLLSNNT